MKLHIYLLASILCCAVLSISCPTGLDDYEDSTEQITEQEQADLVIGTDLILTP